jgi:hypothetical protein
MDFIMLEVLTTLLRRVPFWKEACVLILLVETDPESSKITCGEFFFGRLVTKENLFKRGIGLDSKCPTCALETETLEHLLWFLIVISPS